MKLQGRALAWSAAMTFRNTARETTHATLKDLSVFTD